MNSICELPIVPEDLKVSRQPLANNAVSRAQPVSVTDDGRILRIGSALYALSAADDFKFRRLELGPDDANHFEEVACNQNFFGIASRNRVTKKEFAQLEEHNGPEKPEGPKDGKDISASTSKDGSSSEDSSSDEDTSDSETDTSQGELSGGQDDALLESGSVKSSTRSLSFSLHSEAENSSAYDFDDSEDSIGSNSARESLSEGSTATQSDEIEDEMMWNDFDSDDDNLDSDDQLSKEDENELPVDLDWLSDTTKSVSSDSLEHLEHDHEGENDSEAESESVSSFRGSAYEPSSSYDSDEMGSDDEYNGHGGGELRELLGFRGVGNPKGPVCEIRVFRINENKNEMPKHTFRFMGRSSGSLYASPPAFHPTEDLVVWPLGGNEILFASFTRNSYFTLVIRTGYHKSCQISVGCRFSSCGRYLHMVSLDGVIVTYRDGSKGLGLRLHISTHRLSKGKPTRSPPKLIYRTYLDLKRTFSEADKLSVSNIPYTFNWTGSHIYVTESGVLLRVYRIPLFRDIEAAEKTEDSPKAIFTNSEEVFLPESARYRKVYFFMDSDEQDSGKSKKKSKKASSKLDYVAHAILAAHNLPDDPDATDLAAIGPSTGNIPPQGIHLTAAQLGKWESVEKHGGGIKKMERAETWRGGQLLDKFEKFDRSEDCDIVPYLHS